MQEDKEILSLLTQSIEIELARIRDCERAIHKHEKELRKLLARELGIPEEDEHFIVISDYYKCDDKDMCDWLRKNDPEWFAEMKYSPIGYCVYNTKDDPACDCCLYCGQPEKRK